LHHCLASASESQQKSHESHTNANQRALPTIVRPIVAGLINDLTVLLIEALVCTVEFIVEFAVGPPVGLDADGVGLVVGGVGLDAAGQFEEAGLGAPHSSDAQSESAQGTLQASEPQGHPPVFCGKPEARDMPLTVGTEAE